MTPIVLFVEGRSLEANGTFGVTEALLESPRPIVLTGTSNRGMVYLFYILHQKLIL